MVLGTMYIFVKDFEKSVRFYKELLQEEPLYANDDRWVQFSNKIALSETIRTGRRIKLK